MPSQPFHQNDLYNIISIARVMITVVKSLMMTVEKILMMLMFTCSHLWHTSMATPNSDQVKKRKI